MYRLSHLGKPGGFFGKANALSVGVMGSADYMTLPSPSWIERRISHRVRTLSPIRFHWLTSQGEFLRVRGMTRDISGTGVYSYSEYPLSVGLEVVFDLLFPAELAGREPVMFHCQGRVLRSEQFHSRFGVALSITSHHLIDTAQFYRRSSERVVPASPVIAHYTESQAEVRDLSMTGAFIKDRHPLPVDRKIRLQMQIENYRGEMEVEEAVVRRVTPDAGMGVEFVVLTVDSRRQLKEFLRRHAE